MITFLELGKHGRLGNQLFQYAALKGIALRNNYECKIPDPKQMMWHGQQCLLDQFNIESEYLTDEDLVTLKHQAVEPDPWGYYQGFLDIPDHTNIHGFFQSVNYFQGHEKQICKELTPKAEHMEFAKKYIANLKKDGHQIVSLHLRRGDNTDGSKSDEKYLHFYGKSDIFDTESIYGRYLSEAIKFFENKKVKYLVFTGGSRDNDDSKDINWAKNNFKKDNFVVSETADPMQDLSLIISCDHNITCHMTSFGWWGAYLNPNPQKIVTAPKDYFYDMPADYVREGHFPQDWRLV
tara:strand:- start:417 stop:1295 length:879 start_codon:yes stop_codon:yes gene_type:complete